MTAALAERTGLPGRLLNNAYIPAEHLTFDELLGAVEMAEMIVDASPWWHVDAVAALEERYPHEYLQTLPEANDGPEGKRKARLKQAGWMADRWPRGTRVPGMTFTHHRIVARLDRDEAVSLLTVAAERVDADGRPDPWSTRELIDEVKGRERAIPATVSEPTTCAADAPWTPTLADLAPEWRQRAEASGEPRGYLAALVDTAQESTFLPGRWRD